MRTLLVGLVGLLLTACEPVMRSQSPSDAASDASCTTVHLTAMPTVPSIELLIDRSGSMADPFGDVTRYEAVTEALVGAAGVVTALASKAYVGASLYTSDAACPKLYAVPRALDNRTAIAALLASQVPSGQTPTAGAIDKLVARLIANPPTAASPAVIVLASDGYPTSCDSSSNAGTRTVDAATAAFDRGIRLFVLGVGDQVNTNHLQAVANAGAGVTAGMPDAPYFVATDPAGLVTAFDQVIGGMLTCQLVLGSDVDPEVAAQGTVVLDGVTLAYGTDWVFVNATTIRLLGDACRALHASSDPIVDASFPCGAVVR